MCLKVDVLPHRAVSPYDALIMRTFYVIFVVIALLGCPFRCLLEAATQTSKKTLSSCRCCQKCSQKHQEDSIPSDDSKDGDCSSCPCNGAVKNDDAPEIELALSLAVDSLFVLPLPPSVDPHRVSPSAWHDDDHWIGIAGMSLRIVQQSFLC